MSDQGLGVDDLIKRLHERAGEIATVSVNLVPDEGGPTLLSARGELHHWEGSHPHVIPLIDEVTERDAIGMFVLTDPHGAQVASFEIDRSAVKGIFEVAEGRGSYVLWMFNDTSTMTIEFHGLGADLPT